MPYTTLQKLHGSDCPFPKYKTLRAGNLTVEYSEGTLRNISINGYEVIRMIYVAVRDHAWLNVPQKILTENISISGKEFVIQLSVQYSKNEIEFLSEIRITGTSQNILSYEMKGSAQTDFLKNRIGICLLHPPETCRGKECIIAHPDGTTEKRMFPEKIAPHQPFKNISGMSWNYDRSNKVTLQFKGDLFETEDQRNWTDASYKTYSTPLEIPFPVLLKKNTKVSQSVTIKIDGKSNSSCGSEIINFFPLNGPDLPMPSLGTCVSSAVFEMTAREAELLKRTGFRHLRGEILLFENNWSLRYRRILNEAVQLQLPVVLCLVFGDNCRGEWDKFLSIYKETPVDLSSILLFSRDHKSTPPDIVKSILPEVKKYFPGIRVGAGTNCNFAELNRMTPSSGSLDFLSFAIHPQEHANDDSTLFENMTAQRDAINSAFAVTGGKKIHVSPVTLKRRFNANMINYELPYNTDHMPDQVDVRQMSLFAAAWTVGSLKSVLESGIESVTYYETIGERGILMGKRSLQTGLFPAEEYTIFPVYHIFRLIGESYKIVKSLSSKPLVVDGFILKNEDHGLIFLANFTTVPQSINLNRFNKLITVRRINSVKFNYGTIRDTHAVSRRIIRLLPYETRILQFTE
ncbi:MAG TPA: hypothetical protein VK179_00610 [Bacteroidales bacterium]|nr:hypothetical protein [Bacteroidales bacterium]